MRRLINLCWVVLLVSMTYCFLHVGVFCTNYHTMWAAKLNGFQRIHEQQQAIARAQQSQRAWEGTAAYLQASVIDEKMKADALAAKLLMVEREFNMFKTTTKVVDEKVFNEVIARMTKPSFLDIIIPQKGD